MFCLFQVDKSYVDCFELAAEGKKYLFQSTEKKSWMEDFKVALLSNTSSESPSAVSRVPPPVPPRPDRSEVAPAMRMLTADFTPPPRPAPRPPGPKPQLSKTLPEPLNMKSLRAEQEKYN